MNDNTIDRICEAFAGATSVTGITGIGYRTWREDELNVLCLHEALIEWFATRGRAHPLCRATLPPCGVEPRP